MSSEFIEAQRRHQRGDVAGAIRVYRTILAKKPTDGRSKLYLGLALQQTGHHAAALESAEGCLDLIQNKAFADYSTYGIILKNGGRLVEAIQHFNDALALSPNHPAVLSNLATAHLATGEIEIAEPMFRSLINLLPEDPAPNLNLARIYLRKGDFDEATLWIEAASLQDPAHPDCLYLRAQVALRDAGYALAGGLLVRLLDKHLGHADGWKLLRITVGHDCIDRADIDRLLSKVSAANITNVRILSPAVGIARQTLCWKFLQSLEEKLNAALEEGISYQLDVTSVFDLLGCAVSQKAHLNAARLAWSTEIGSVAPVRHEMPEVRQKKIRVGFLSSDLREHAIGHLIAGIIPKLSSEKIEWIAYSNAGDDGGPNRQLFRASLKNLKSVYRMDDKELAQLIVEDEIDVLIDLNGMTADTRVRVFSMRPAPVQIQWLGMPGSLGGGVDVDYVIVDPWVVSNDNANGFSEALLSLPRSYQPNDHRPVDLSPSASRVSEGLPENGVVFGCFNQHYKISPDTFSCWMKILGQVPGAVLWLLQPKSDGVRARLEDLATEHGVDPGRLVFAKFAPQSAHIARLRWMDLVLDTWPYNAHTTCSDALRAGCPVLTLPGRTFASRVAEGILKTANLHDWVVSDQSDYVARAVSYGLQSREEIDRTKALVRDTYWSSSMVDNDLLAQQLEAVVLGVFERHKKGLPIQSLQLDDSLVLRPLSYGRSDLAIDETGLFAVNQKFAVDTSSATSTEEPRDIRMASAPVNLPPKTSQWLDRIKKGTPAARPDNIKLFKSDVIMYNEIPLVLDVGAADFNAPIGYEPLIKAGLAKVLGFEPDPDSFAKLEQSENTKHLKLALGDGEAHKLSVCTAPGMNSILSPRMEWLALFPMFSTWGTVNGQVPVVTSRLDDVNEAKDARFMKIDVQGAEMMILEHGQQVLNGLALLQIEASPSPLYHNEASLWKIGEWLSERGFVLHCFSELNKRRLKPYGDDHAPFLPSNQLLQVDAVFMPDPLKWDQLSDSRLFSLAFFAHVIYRSHDLAMLAMQKLDKRDSGQRVERYRLYLEAAGLDA